MIKRRRWEEPPKRRHGRFHNIGECNDDVSHEAIDNGVATDNSDTPVCADDQNEEYNADNGPTNDTTPNMDDEAPKDVNYYPKFTEDLRLRPDELDIPENC